MSEVITIKNDELTVSVKTFGAELTSIKTADGYEHLWQGNPDIWAGQAPVLFPIVGRLENNKYIYNGTEYTLKKHGFASGKQFEVESAEPERAVLILREDEETKKSYPFDFEFRTIFEVCGGSLNVTYSVRNMNDTEMYCSFGGHEAYNCPGGVSDYSVIFDEKETLSTYTVVKGVGLLDGESTPVLENDNILPLSDEDFMIDAFVFLDAKSRGVTLFCNRTGERLHVDFPGFDTLLLWSRPGAPFLCIEPWCGMPDFMTGDRNISKKRGILEIAPRGVCERTHTITPLGDTD